MGIEPTEVILARSLPTEGTAAKRSWSTQRRGRHLIVARGTARPRPPGRPHVVELEGVEPVRFLLPRQASHLATTARWCARQVSNPHLSA